MPQSDPGLLGLHGAIGIKIPALCFFAGLVLHDIRGRFSKVEFRVSLPMTFEDYVGKRSRLCITVLRKIPATHT